MEAGLVNRAGIPFEPIPAAGVHGVGPRALPGNLLQLGRGYLAARQLLRRSPPEAAFFTGGYVGVPVALAARRLPKAAFVPDIEPGAALRWITRGAESVFVVSEQSRQHYAAGRPVRVSGYPSRFAGHGLARDEGRRGLGLSPDRPVLLVMGGSRGAHSINQALWSHLADVLQRAQVVHLTGSLDWSRATEARRALPAPLRPEYHAFDYLHEDMGLALAAADLAVSRAGASALGDYPHFSLPSVLVPYPYAWRYQQVNAKYLESHGAAVVVADDELDAKLVTTVDRLLGDAEGRSRMARAARGLAAPGAAGVIADELLRLGGGTEALS